jgi:hypothetical protein
LLAVLLGALGGSLLWSGTLSSPENALARSYQSAFADSDARAMRVIPAALAESTQTKPIDAIWTGKADGHGLALYRPLGVGERITMSGRDGKPDKLTVVGVEQIDGAAFGSPGLRFQMVTSKLDGGEDRLVRFLIAIEKHNLSSPDKSL